MKVFVFGAGISCPAGFPLGKDLMCQLKEFVERRPAIGGPYGPIAEMWTALEERGVFNPLDDLELNLSRLQIDMRRLRAAARRGENVSALNPATLSGEIPKILFDFLRQRHEEVRRTPNSTSYLADFVRWHIRPGDVVFTFNYDCLIELALLEQGLWTLRDGYGIDLAARYPTLGQDRKSDVQLIKLHGSLGWYWRFDSGRPGFRMGPLGAARELIVQRTVLSLLGYDGLEDANPPVGGGAVIDPMEVPSYLKGLSNFPLPELWKRAAEFPIEAERVIVSGYSFPDADSSARTLLLATPRGKPFDYYWYGEDVQRVEEIERFLKAGGVRFHDRVASIEALAGMSELPLATAT